MTVEPYMPKEKTERDLFRLFEIGVVLKGLNGLLEFGLGVLFLFVNVGALVQDLITHALIEDPDNYLARHLQSLAGHINPHAQLYSALYLMSHGLIKLILVWGLLKGKLWAYPASLAILGLFVLYQCIQYIGTHSILMLGLTIFDLIVMWLIYHEYRIVSRRRVLR